MIREIDILLYRRGESIPFSEWLASLKDVRTRSIVRARLHRIRLGNFGDCKSVGRGVEELRIDFGPGYRVSGRRGAFVVILLCGGAKRTQARDFPAAQRYGREHLNAETERQG